MEGQRLNEYIAGTFGDVLQRLGMYHVEYIVDGAAFGNEIDRYSNSRIRIDFILDRGEKFIQIVPLGHRGDFFDLQYLIEMLEPNEEVKDFEGFEILPRVINNVYALFDSKYYSCHQRAYRSFEDCRNRSKINSVSD